GVGLVGRRRGEEGDIGRVAAPRGLHDNGRHVLVAAARKLDAVDAAAQVLGQRDAGRRLPSGIADVVVVQVDGAVLVGRVAPVVFVAGPVVPGHGAGRQVDRAAMAAVAGNVLDTQVGHGAAEIPGQRDAARAGGDAAR